MTRKHFNAIAHMVAANIQTAKATEEQAEEIINDWLNYLATTNQLFKGANWADYVRAVVKARGYNYE